jgi:hypothetical protein
MDKEEAMEIVYGVEMNNRKEITHHTYGQLIKEFAHKVPIIGQDKNVYVVASKAEEELLTKLLLEKEVFEDTFPLFQLKQPEITPLFYDYGFITTDGTYYLYEELTFPFFIKKGNPQQLEMGLFQMMEHTICKDIALKNENLFFADKQQKELIEGIAKAYDIEVSIFELDK